ncbi:MAG: glycosyltransferase family 4 protein [Ferruginibacter sp.]
MSEKKTILHIIDNMGRGGAEVMLVKVLKELKEYYNIVVTLNPQNHFGEELVCDEYHCLHMGFFFRFPLAVMRLRSVIRKKKIDIVHSHLFTATLVARLGTPKDIPLVTTIHTNVSASAEYKKGYLHFLEKMSYRRRPGTIIAVSEVVMDAYYRFFGHTPGKRQVLYTFVDTRETVTDTGIPGEGSGSFRLAAIGALRYPKNQQFLIRALARLTNENIELDIYGSGPRHEELRQLINESGANVTLKGEVKNASSLLSRYDLYVMPSEFEGFSLSILEAMAMGTPMLVSDIPSFREQCADTAVFFDLTNVDDFIAKLKDLAADKEKRVRLSQAAKQRVYDHFTLEHHMAGLRKIYNETLQNP